MACPFPSMAPDLIFSHHSDFLILTWNVGVSILNFKQAVGTSFLTCSVRYRTARVGAVILCSIDMHAFGVFDR